VPFCEIDDGRISIRTEFHDRHLVQELPGARYDRKAEVWTAPLSWASCITLRGLFGERFTAGEKLAEWSWDTYNNRIEPAMRMRAQLELGHDFPELDALEEGRSRKLYNYQRVDVQFLLTNKRSLLLQPPGMGKSGVVIRYLQLMQARGDNPFPALVICPNSLKFATWQGEFEAWAPELIVQVVDGNATQRRKQLESDAQIFVLNWESVRLHSRLAGYGTISLTEKEASLKELNDLGLRAVIADEAHKMKDARASQSRAVWAVMHQAEYRVGMTGTPISNNVGDLWSLLHAIEPEWFPAKTKFIARFAEVSTNYFGGTEVLGVNPHNEDEFFRIVDPLMRRVPKEAALPQLPPKLPVQIRHTVMGASQKSAYESMRKGMIAQLNELLVAPNPLSQLTRLAQFAAASAEIDEDGKVRLTTPSPKVDDMIDLLEEMGEEPLVVAAVSRQLIEMAAAKLEKLKISHGLITGAQSTYERQQTVQRFQAGHIRVALMTLGAGAEGITLTRANTLLFMQKDWSQVKNLQAADRIHRIGSERHDVIRIIEQVTPGTVEEHKRDVLGEKEVRMEQIVRDEISLRRLLGG
jgi:SNF2 family DNA or RNA helicase